MAGDDDRDTRCTGDPVGTTSARRTRCTPAGTTIRFTKECKWLTTPRIPCPADAQWLKRYYFSRAVFSLLWVALAFSVGRQSAAGAAILLIVYPAWDALANFVDLARSGGAATNRTQAVNVAISAATTLAVFRL